MPLSICLIASAGYFREQSRCHREKPLDPLCGEKSLIAAKTVRLEHDRVDNQALRQRGGNNLDTRAELTCRPERPLKYGVMNNLRFPIRCESRATVLLVPSRATERVESQRLGNSAKCDILYVQGQYFYRHE